MVARHASSTAALQLLLCLVLISSALSVVVDASGQQQGNTTNTDTADDDEVNNNSKTIFSADRKTIVTNQAMGARCAVSADFDGDGLLDLVSASSNDNAVSWYKNLAYTNNNDALLFSIKNEITWSSLGSRIVTVGDVNRDGIIDVVGASYYDSSLRWYENDGTGIFTEHLISNAVDEGQGVTLADLDNDGDLDVISASSGDNTIAVFKNIDHGIFCEIKVVVDSDAIGARTVIAADINGDGWLDLASASKDDNTVAWYPNDGTGHFGTKLIVSRGEESKGAYSLVAVDIDQDGDQDLIVASNGNDHVSIWRNDGSGNFDKTLVFDNADFVLSVTAVDFDRDGDVDIASASFFDGHINWYENIDGMGYEWKNHTIYVGTQGHYVSYGDVDGDGDYDLIAVDHAENSVTVFYASTECDADKGSALGAECCLEGSEWNGTACELCSLGTYGVGFGADAQCVDCPIDDCTIPGWNALPTTCMNRAKCTNVDESLASCTCPIDTVFDPETDTCLSCPSGQIRPDIEGQRGLDTLGNYAAWEVQQGTCVDEPNSVTAIVGGVLAGILALLFIMFLLYRHKKKKLIIEQQEVIKLTAQELKKRESELKAMQELKGFSIGKSKFGDAVTYVNSLIDEANGDSDMGKLALVKSCLIQGGNDSEMHVPNNLSKSDNAYIMENFAGVNKRTLRKSIAERKLQSKRSSTQNFSLVKSMSVKAGTTSSTRNFSYVRTSGDGSQAMMTPSVECLPEFTNLDSSKQMELFKLLSFSNLKRWDFNVFDVAAIDDKNTLLFISWAVVCSPYSQIAMAKELGLAGNEDLEEGYDFFTLELTIDNVKLCNFFQMIQDDYMSVPYHNHIHAADVVQTLNSLIQLADQSVPFDGEDLFLILVASVAHDVKHPGRNNGFQVNSFSDLSLSWNDQSVLENEHAYHAFKVMIERQGAHFLLNAPPARFAEFRKQIIDAILHTDMTKHFASVGKIKSQAAGKLWEELGDDVRWEVLMFMLHLADISNPAKGDPMFKLWTDRCLDEFFAQGDKEREMGLAISPNCDRNTIKRPDSQIGFINFVVKPAYEVLADVIPNVRETILPVIESNLSYWKEQKDSEETV